jgi:hypothetical protein
MKNKKWITVALMILGVESSMACPNLTGVFECIDEDQKPFDMEVRQSEQSGVTTYYFTTDGVTDSTIADGNSHDLPYDPNLRDAKYTANCSGSLVEMKMTGRVFTDEGFEFGSFEVTGQTYVDLRGDLEINIKGGVYGTPIGDHPINSKETCRRK